MTFLPSAYNTISLEKGCKDTLQGRELDVNKTIKAILSRMATLKADDTDWTFYSSVNYWCGCLMNGPFCELEKEYTEGDICQILISKHTEPIINPENSGDIQLIFRPEWESPLKEWLAQYPDGYGQNIPYSWYSAAKHFIEKFQREIIITRR